MVVGRMNQSRPGLFDRAQQAEQRGNREVRDMWERYRSHREQVTAAILALSPNPGGRLCLLGAGNANDLELDRLAAHFDEVHLVDIDPGALARASGRQAPAVRERLRSHAPVDLSGLYRRLDHTAESPQRKLPPIEELVTAGTAAVVGQLPSGFDVVASCCVLSQMSWALQRLLKPGGADAALPVLEQALVRVHLRTLLGLIRPSGAALLVADLVSTEVYPLDELPADEDLGALVDELAAGHVAYAVCNPHLIRQILRKDATLATTCAPPAQGQAWLWEGPKQATYLVYPLVLKRRG
jgi:hypothetical protein